uniref:Calcium signal-modulating cyclophilin ligand n=1 Tax=Anopheles culicifacies TaxID=139723 RepID=A0A182MB14_9DIPT
MDETAELVQQPKTQEEILAARREARRKKILENSNNRLSKIVGQEIAPSSPKSADSVTDESISTISGGNLSSNTFPADDETTSEPSYGIYPDPMDERLEYISPQVEALLANSGINDDSFLNAMTGGTAGFGGTNPNGDIFQLLNTLNQAQANGGGLFGGGLANATSSPRSSATNQPTSAAHNNSWYARALRSKVHLIVASIVAYLLFATGNESYIGGNVFLLLLAWELIELLTIGTSEPANAQKLLGVVFMLGGIPMKTSQTIMKLMNTVNNVLKDVAFFMFFFVLTHLLWSTLWLGIELRYVLGYDQLEPPA